MRNFKRILALALTVLMVVGVVPMSIFAVQSTLPEGEKVTEGFDGKLSDSCGQPTGTELQGMLGSSAQIYFNDYSGSAEIKQNITDNLIIKATTSDSDGVRHITPTASDSNKSVFLVFLDKMSDMNSNKATTVKDVIISNDYKLDGATNSIAEGALIRLYGVANGSWYTAYPLIISNGVIFTNPESAYKGEPWNASGWNGTYIKNSKKIATLSTDEYTNITFQLRGNEFRVFVNGVDASGWLKFMSDSVKTQYGSDFGLGRVDFFPAPNSSCYIDNTAIYTSSSVPKKSDTLTGTELQGMLGSSAQIYFNDYSGSAEIKQNITDNLIIKATTSDSDGVRHITPTASDSNKSVFLVFLDKMNDMNNNRNTIVKDVIISNDYKLDGATNSIAEGALIRLYGVANGSWYTAYPLIISNGVIFTNPESAYKGEPWNASGWSGTYIKNSKKIATLSTDEYTNITFQLRGNEFRVFVNGVDASGWLKFMSDSVKTQYGSDFGLGRVDFFPAPNSSCYIDNTAIYTSSEIAERAIPKNIFDTVTKTGYKAENGAVYYYENGVKVTNKVSADGMLSIGADGKVFYDGTAVTDMSAYYNALVNGDIIPVDGMYAGVYTANAIMGATAGNSYFFDTDGALVTNQTDYDINGVTYDIDANGVLGNARVQMPTTEVNASNPVTVNGVVCDSFTDVLDAVPAGTAVTLSENVDYTGESIVLSNDVTLDLNGKTITADGFTVLTDTFKIKDSAGTGSITVGKSGGVDNLITSGVNKSNAMVLKTAETETSATYVVRAVADQKEITTDEENGTFTITFRPSFANSTDGNKALLGAGSDAANIIIRVEITDSEGNPVGKDSYDFSDGLVSQAYSNHKALQITMRGFTAAHGTVTVKYSVVSGTGMVCTLDTFEYTSTKA